jgi:D-alanyl-lipoteichoic acid acyltransferase DltB (MBOAT superfamily)
MKPTKFQTLIAWAVISTTAGYLVPKLIVANGGQVPIATLSLIITLPLIAILLVLFALPMIRAYRSSGKTKLAAAAKSAKTRTLINPFYAVRVVLLAKAIAIAGAIFFGWQLGLVWLQFSAPVITAAIWYNLAALIGALLMLIAGWIIERVCRIRDDSNGEPGTQGGTKNIEANPA